MIEIIALPNFQRDVKLLQKKHLAIREDLEPLIQQLRQGETPGDQFPGTGFTVYKVRLASRAMRRGKRGGLRVIYYIRTPERIFLLSIYAKSQQADISPEEIRRIIEEETRN